MHSNVFSGAKTIGLMLVWYPTDYPRRVALRPVTTGCSIHLDTLQRVSFLISVLLRDERRTLCREPSLPVHISSASSIFSAATSPHPPCNSTPPEEGCATAVKGCCTAAKLAAKSQTLDRARKLIRLRPHDAWISRYPCTQPRGVVQRLSRDNPVGFG